MANSASPFFQIKSELERIVNKVRDTNTVATKRNQYDLKTFYKNLLQKTPLYYSHQFFIEFYGTGLKDIYFNQWAMNSDDILNPKFWIKSASIPNVDITPAKVNFLANGFEVPGVVKYPDTWQVTFMLDQQLSQYRFLQLQQRYMASLENSGGRSQINSRHQSSCLDFRFYYETNY